MLNDNLRQMCKEMRLKALDMAYKAGGKGAHFGAGFSSMEILAVLYGRVMNIDPKNPTMEGRDRFIPSKAHCTLSFYTALGFSGYFDPALLDTFEENESDFGGHPFMNDKYGIDFSGGSLGMGLSLGVGLALASKRKNNNAKIFVLLGDGELNEGSVWEAIMSASHFKLDNLYIIVDNNKLQYDGPIEDVMSLGSIEEKFKAFGAETFSVDGNDVDALVDVFEKATLSKVGKPRAIIAETIKGKGISFMENAKEWHHGSLTEAQYEQAKKELQGASL